MKKKLLSALLTVSLLFGAAGTAYASGETCARFYNIYGSNMIFEQNCTAELAGTGPSGVTVGGGDCKLVNARGYRVP